MTASQVLIATSAALATVGALWLLLYNRRRKLDLSNWTSLCLIEKESLNHNTSRYRFALPQPESTLNLPLGRHLQVRVPVTPVTEANGGYAIRSYTPTEQGSGYFDLIVKTYPQGRVSSHLASLEIGQRVEFRGPRGDYEHQPGRLGMIAGGTGITPMLQVCSVL